MILRAQHPERTRKRELRLAKLRDALTPLTSFDADSLQNCLKRVAAELGVKAGAVVHPARLACTGKTIGPSLYHLLEVLGKERVLTRLERAIRQT